MASASSFRLDANPLLDNGDKCLSTGRKDKVLILWTTLEVLGDPTVCNVRPGTPVFFYTTGGE